MAMRIREGFESVFLLLSLLAITLSAGCDHCSTAEECSAYCSENPSNSEECRNWCELNPVACETACEAHPGQCDWLDTPTATPTPDGPTGEATNTPTPTAIPADTWPPTPPSTPTVTPTKTPTATPTRTQTPKPKKKKKDKKKPKPKPRDPKDNPRPNPGPVGPPPRPVIILPDGGGRVPIPVTPTGGGAAHGDEFFCAPHGSGVSPARMSAAAKGAKLDTSHIGVVRDRKGNVAVVGTLQKDGRHYIVSAHKRKGATLRFAAKEFVPMTMPLEDTNNLESLPTISHSLAAGEPGNCGSKIELLGVYTPQLAASMHRTEILAAFNKGICEANLALKNSLVDASFTVAGVEKIGLSETGAAETDIQALIMNENVLQLRREKKADLVVAMLRQAESNICGKAKLPDLTQPGMSARYLAYSINRFDCIMQMPVLAHEIGHNLGMMHDVAHSGSFVPAKPYAYGWEFVAGGGLYGDVMSYVHVDGGEFVLYYSTPLVSFQGVPVGDAEKADNARTARENIPQIACYSELL